MVEGHPVSLDEFSTCAEDRPLIAQIAANDVAVAAGAAEALAPFVDGVDFNCGCPQPWVIKDGIGAALSAKPELVADLVRAVRSTLPADKTLSIKIRLRPDLRLTAELMRRAERMGVSWVTVHGRTREERTSVPVRLPAIRLLKSVVSVPVIANGDVVSPEGMRSAVAATGADGVLIARGALANPALFAGAAAVPEGCLSDYLSLALRYGGGLAMHSHHVLYMGYSCLPKPDKLLLTKVKSLAGLVDLYEAMGWPVAAGTGAGAGGKGKGGETGVGMGEEEEEEGKGGVAATAEGLLQSYAPIYSASQARVDYSMFSFSLELRRRSLPAYSLDPRVFGPQREGETWGEGGKAGAAAATAGAAGSTAAAEARGPAAAAGGNEDDSADWEAAEEWGEEEQGEQGTWAEPWWPLREGPGEAGGLMRLSADVAGDFDFGY